MKLFTLTTDTDTYFVLAEEKWEAEAIVTREHFPILLDDDLADIYEVEEYELKPGIITQVESDSTATETFKEQYERIRMK